MHNSTESNGLPKNLPPLSDFLKAGEPYRDYLDVPSDDVAGVRVRSLTELERSQNDQFIFGEDGKRDPEREELQTAHLMWLSLVDENGNQCYSPEQITSLANLPERISQPILEAIFVLRNGHPSKKNGLKTTSEG